MRVTAENEENWKKNSNISQNVKFEKGKKCNNDGKRENENKKRKDKC